MALREVQEYIALDANNITLVISPAKEPSNNNIIIYMGLCVSSYYLTIVSDCGLPFCLFTISPGNNIIALFVTL